MLAPIKDALTSAFDLSFEQTVPRGLVHKKCLENVFLTEIKSHGDSCFVCGARMPAAHRFFNESSRSPNDDILFYTEVGRQASVATSHAFFGVAHDQVFIFEQSEACLIDKFWRSAYQAGPSSVAVEIRIKEKETRKNGDVARIVAEHTIYNERELVFQGTGAWSI